jgi:hypothetical protein
MTTELTEERVQEMQKMLAEGSEPHFEARRGFLVFLHTVLGGDRVEGAAAALEPSGRMAKGRFVVFSEKLIAVLDVEGLGSIHTMLSGDTEPISVSVLPRSAITGATLKSQGWTERWPFHGPDFEYGTDVELAFGPGRAPLTVSGPPAAVSRLYRLAIADLAR